MAIYVDIYVPPHGYIDGGESSDDYGLLKIEPASRHIFRETTADEEQEKNAAANMRSTHS